MATGVVAFGLLILAFGLLGAIRPAALIQLLQRAWSTRSGLYLAAGFRLLFGVTLLLAARTSAYPTALTFLGCLSLVASLLALLIGYARALAFVEWWSQSPVLLIRASSLVAIAFGSFLIAAVA